MAGKELLLNVMTEAGCVSLQVESGQRLLDILQNEKIYVSMPCGGRGSCGKCKVKLISGRLRTDEGSEGVALFVLPGKEALACQTRIVEDCTVDVVLLGERNFVGVIDFTISAHQEINTGLHTLRLETTENIWDDGCSATEIISGLLGRRLAFSRKSLCQLSNWLSGFRQQQLRGIGEMPHLLLLARGDRVLRVRTFERSRTYGIGVDIGTTTVGFALVDLVAGKLIKSFSLLNSQRQYGADVISRIQKGSEGLSEALRECICSDIVRGIAALCEGEEEAVVRMVIAGNTTMLHLLLGLRSDSLAVFPFQPVTAALMEVSSHELFGINEVDCEVTLLPSIGAYIGADIVSGMMYCQMERATGVSLLIDVGTNGEMAVKGNGRLLCASTAAGPAFEGANITWGTGSVPGAIESVKIQGENVVFRTIGNEPPIGICGSAVVDIVAGCLREGIVDRTGRFMSDEVGKSGMKITQNPAGEWICFTQKDIREFQLAKSAIRSGLEILIRECGCTWSSIDRVYLAGGFGTRMNVENAVAVGLFPVEIKDKIQSVGNSALGGTVHYLLYEECRRSVDGLVKNATVIDLSTQTEFNDLFLQHLQF